MAGRIVTAWGSLKRAARIPSLPGDDPVQELAVTVLTGDWTELRAHGPFDVLVLDGGGSGKGSEPPLDPAEWMKPGRDDRD